MKIDKTDLAKLKKKMQKRIAAELDVPIRKTRDIKGRTARINLTAHDKEMIDRLARTLSNEDCTCEMLDRDPGTCPTCKTTVPEGVEVFVCNPSEIHS